MEMALASGVLARAPPPIIIFTGKYISEQIRYDAQEKNYQIKINIFIPK